MNAPTPPLKNWQSLPITLDPLTASEQQVLFSREPDQRDVSPERCVTCRGKKQFRWYTSSARDEVADYACPCADQFAAHRRFAYSGVPLAYQRYSDADFFDDDPARDDAVENFIEHLDAQLSNGTGLFFYGPPGTGKSLALYLLIKRLLCQGVSARAIPASDLSEEYSAHWRSPDADVDAFRHNVLMKDVLFIDDLGRERRRHGSGDTKGRDVVGNALEETVRARVQNAKPTLFSSNDDPETLSAVYGPATATLIEERTRFVALSAESARPEASKRLLHDASHGLIRPIFYR